MEGVITDRQDYWLCQHCYSVAGNTASNYSGSTTASNLDCIRTVTEEVDSNSTVDRIDFAHNFVTIVRIFIDHRG